MDHLLSAICWQLRKPAMDVATDRIPDSTDALATIGQLTSPMTAADPMVATNVCAMVLQLSCLLRGSTDGYPHPL